MRIIAFALAVILAFASYANRSADSVKVSFRLGQSQFDPTLGDNREAMESFIRAVKQADAEENIDSIVIMAYASPDGPSDVNAILAQQRCDVIADLIARRSGVNRRLIHKTPEGIAWDELRRLVADTPDVPARQQILNILDNTPVFVYDAHGKIIDGRKKQLMDLNGGRTYKWLYANLFPLMRNAMAIALIRKQDMGSAPEEIVIDNLSEPESETTTIIDKTIDGQASDYASPPSEPLTTDQQDISCTPLNLSKEKSDSRFALKTNLLFYAILMPNLELEWKFADRWSAALEGQIAWWAKEPGHKIYRIATVIPEVRYWAIEHSRWKGMYVGLFAGGGLYDLSGGNEGHEGEGFMVGASVGYMWPISKHLSLDAGIGLGYMRARDKEYRPLDGHFLYQLTKNINYFGPLRLKLSLVWRIPH